MATPWENALERYQAQHFRVFTHEQLLRTSVSALISGLPTSAATILFLENLTQSHLSLSEAFFTSVQSTDGVVKEFPPLKQLLEDATHVAILYGEHFAWKSPDKWSYLFEVRDGRNASNFILAHPPASREQIQQAEAMLKMSLPLSYVQLLQATNGLGITPNETQFICGVGNTRAAWEIEETFQTGAFHRALYHEIASYWFQWQDSLRYERERECETGVNTFLSDESIYVPFAYTVDDWCFDRSHPDTNGEYPIMFWDHELYEASYEYPSFEAWFREIVVHRHF